MKLKIVSLCITLIFLGFVGFSKQHAQVRLCYVMRYPSSLEDIFPNVRILLLRHNVGNIFFYFKIGRAKRASWRLSWIFQGVLELQLKYFPSVGFL